MLISILAQHEKEKWQRVYTGEEFIVEINASSLRFEPERILRASFQTILSKPQNLREKPGTKYRRRLETIDFKLDARQYRFYETKLLDSTGNTVQSTPMNSVGDWTRLKDGGMMERLFNAARMLRPFGSWRVTGYRFGEGNETADARELKSLIGTRVRIDSDRAEVGVKVCALPNYQSRRDTKEEFSRTLGIVSESIGIKANSVDSIIVKCERDGWAPPQSLLVKLPEGGMLMLWNGVFLELRSERAKEPLPFTLKRRSPLPD